MWCSGPATQLSLVFWSREQKKTRWPSPVTPGSALKEPMTQHVALCPVGQGHEYPGGPWYGVAASTLRFLTERKDLLASQVPQVILTQRVSENWKQYKMEFQKLGTSACLPSSLGLLTRAHTMVKLPQLTEASEDSPTRQP